MGTEIRFIAIVVAFLAIVFFSSEAFDLMSQANSFLVVAGVAILLIIVCSISAFVRYRVRKYEATLNKKEEETTK